MSAEIVVWYCLQHAWNFPDCLTDKAKPRISLWVRSLSLSPLCEKEKPQHQWCSKGSPPLTGTVTLTLSHSAQVRTNKAFWFHGCYTQAQTIPSFQTRGPSTCCKQKQEQIPPPTLRILYSCLECHWISQYRMIPAAMGMSQGPVGSDLNRMLGSWQVLWKEANPHLHLSQLKRYSQQQGHGVMQQAFSLGHQPAPE